MTLFIFQFLLTNIVFSLILCGMFIRLDNLKTISSLELLLYSLGTGPIFTSLILYYLFLFLPNRSYLFYFIAIFMIFFLIAYWGRTGITFLWSELKLKMLGAKRSFQSLSRSKKREGILFSGVLTFLLFLFLILYFTIIIHIPLEESDAMKYAILGKNLFQAKSLDNRWQRIDSNTGFYQVANHAPSFSLLLTWEKIIDSSFKVDKDMYYKSTSGYYALLLLSVFIYWISKRGKYLALLGVFILFSGSSFFFTFIQQHLDSFRLFFLLVSWIFLAYAIKNKDPFSFLMLGFFSGLAAFAHTIGAILVLFNALVLFLFLRDRLKYRFLKTSYVAGLMILFGWLHYILDIFWGFGWVIFDRHVSWWG